MAHQLLSQLPLGLSLRDEATFDNYYSVKIEIVSQLRKTSGGSAKSHLFMRKKRSRS